MGKRVKDLSVNPNNPREVTETDLEQLGISMEELGDISGIVFNVRSGNLVAGNQRSKEFDESSEVKITNRLKKPNKQGTTAYGYILHKGERFSYREVDWTEDWETAGMIAANNHAGTWNREILVPQLKRLSSFDVDFNMKLTMFDDEELQELGVGGIIVSEHLRHGPTGVDEDDVPEKAPARTKSGDIYQMGDHRLLCGDATQLEPTSAFMGEERAQMVWTDPPYNVDYVGKNKAAMKIMNDKMDDETFRKFLTKAFTNMASVTVLGGAVYIAHADSESYNFRGAARDSGWLVKQCLIWKKSSLVMGRQDFHWIHEPILYGWKAGGSHQWFNDRKQTTVLEFAKPHRNAEHPTMKPVELVEYCVGNNTKEGDFIFDPFGGSGTTLIACEKLGRKCRTIELDPGYCDVIVERWEKYTGKKAKLLNQRVKTKKAAKAA